MPSSISIIVMIIIIINIMILINRYHCIYIYTCTNTTKLFTYSKIYMNKCITFLSVSIRAHAMTIDNAAAAKKRTHNESQTTMQLRLPCKRLKIFLAEQNEQEKLRLLPESHAQSWTDSRNASTIQTRSLL